MSLLYAIAGFIVVVSILVFIHEWGHYIVARFFNVKVLRFSIGFGPVLWRRQAGETEWALSAIPLGGYVALLNTSEHAVSEAERQRAFDLQPPLRRMAIVAAGPLINLLFAWLAFSLVFLMGVESVRPAVKIEQGEGLWAVTAVEDTPVWRWSDLYQQVLAKKLAGASQVKLMLIRWPDERKQQAELSLEDFSLEQMDVRQWLQAHGLRPALPVITTRVGHVQPGTPAAQAGLQPGDKIVEINGQFVKDWQHLVEKIARLPQPVATLLIERNGQPIQKRITLAERNGRYFLGIAPETEEAIPDFFRVSVSYGLGEALIAGWEKGWQLFSMTLQSLWHMVTGEISPTTLTGPVGIAQYSGLALQSGLASFLSLMGLISLSLGVLNLLPIPMLDGGHLLYDTIELVTGRPVSDNVREAGQKLGLLVILLLTALALTNDLTRLIHG